MRPLLLDLFCGAGGAAMGYHRAGFDVIGVDINPQPNYPFEFVQGDALVELPLILSNPCYSTSRRLTAIHASPPCQRYSKMSNCRPGLADQYPDLVGPTRDLLQLTGLPYVIENVEGAPLFGPVMLCPMMFGRELYRHRLFEASFPLEQPDHPQHVKSASKAGHWKPGTVMSIAGHIAPVAMGRELMDIDWTTRDELAEAIPPYFTEHIGAELLQAIEVAA
jgi:DNA (cytosine-5)-methyltransferase 1